MASRGEEFRLGDVEEAVDWFRRVRQRARNTTRIATGGGGAKAAQESREMFSDMAAAGWYSEDVVWATRLVCKLLKQELGGQLVTILQDNAKEVRGWQKRGAGADGQWGQQRAAGQSSSTDAWTGSDKTQTEQDPWGKYKGWHQSTEWKRDQWPEDPAGRGRHPGASGDERMPGDWGCPCGNNV